MKNFTGKMYEPEEFFWTRLYRRAALAATLQNMSNLESIKWNICVDKKILRDVHFNLFAITDRLIVAEILGKIRRSIKKSRLAIPDLLQRTRVALLEHPQNSKTRN